ncbi:hypothetical protein [Stenotrophomonas sp.]|uniref:hypothetical protein n=1 Tax=Stenotrophomonas sp. TaxID=69392 RepID=UPI00289906E7|nr:hypothetical protein [Stenotrophomonas sp.]
MQLRHLAFLILGSYRLATPRAGLVDALTLQARPLGTQASRRQTCELAASDCRRILRIVAERIALALGWQVSPGAAAGGAITPGALHMSNAHLRGRIRPPIVELRRGPRRGLL